MPITVERKGFRACPVCYQRSPKDGFHLKNQQGYSSFRCIQHTLDLLQQDPEKGNDLPPDVS